MFHLSEKCVFCLCVGYMTFIKLMITLNNIQNHDEMEENNPGVSHVAFHFYLLPTLQEMNTHYTHHTRSCDSLVNALLKCIYYSQNFDQ